MTPEKIKPGKYEISYTEKRSCIGFVHITEEHAEKAGQSLSAAAELALQDNLYEPHDVCIDESRVEDVFDMEPQPTP